MTSDFRRAFAIVCLLALAVGAIGGCEIPTKDVNRLVSPIAPPLAMPL